MKNRFARPIITTLILASALVTFGCKESFRGADMTREPIVKQSEDVKPEKKILDAVPTKQKDSRTGKKDIKKLEKPPIMELKPPKKTKHWHFE